MKSETIKVLAIEDSPADLLMLQESLSAGPLMEFQFTGVQLLEEGMVQLQQENYDVVLLDLHLPDSHGLPTLGKLRAKFPDTAIIVLTGFNDEAAALQAIQSGAQDYIVKGQMPGPMQVRAIRYALERKRSEQALRMAKDELARVNLELEKRVSERTSELQLAIAELEALSYSLSHDLRAPLRAMQGFAEALLDEYAHKIDEPGQDYLQRICRAATRLDLLVQEVLNYNWTSQSKVKLTPIDLNLFIRETVEASPALQAPHIEIHIEEPMPHVLGHPAFISQILSNLLSNAVKFTAPEVSPKISISSELASGMVRVSVQDNGIGIDSAHFERIFQIFGRVYPDKLYEGTGIGLAIVKKAVERMGGEIGVESRLGHGSRFWFTLKQA